MPNKSLIPFKPGKGFTKGTDIGFTRTTTDYDLKSIAERCVTPGADNAENREDHAIPSPIAHILQFKKLLRDNNEIAINEWRGMLAVIALQKNFVFNIKMVTRNLTTTKLGKIILKKLKESCDWGDSNQISYFLFNNIPFAFVVPKLGICPFKTYPADLFDSVVWYNYNPQTKTGTWLNVIRTLNPSEGQLTISGKKLYSWLNIQQGFGSELIDFKTAALKGMTETQAISNLAELHNLDVIVDDANRTRNNLVTLNLDCLLKAADQILGMPAELFSDKLLIYIANEAYDPSPLCFVEEIPSLNDRNHGDSKILIIPPFSADFAKFYNDKHRNYDPKDKNIEKNCRVLEVIYDYRALLENKNMATIKCTISVDLCGQIISVSKTFNQSEIIFTDNIPYLSLWPNVDLPDDMWMSYYLSVVDREKGGRDAGDIGDKIAEKIMNKLDAKNIKLSVSSKGNNNDVIEYDVTSSLQNKNFKIFHSKTIPQSIELINNEQGVDVILGQLIIDHKRQPGYINAPIDFRSTINIGIDFGTTSTNCYINNIQEKEYKSIDAPGKYVLDIVTTDASNDKMERDKYLVTSNEDILNKFFTVGQMFSAKNRATNRDAEKLPHVVGRAFLIDQKLWSYLSNDSDQKRSGVYFDLKYLGGRNSREANIISATSLFLKNILETAALQARMLGAKRVNIIYSYPFRKQLEKTQTVWNEVFASVRKSSGFIDAAAKDLRIENITEAEAAGHYYKNLPAGELHPDIDAGYAIIDIGGGTSDISVWQKRNIAEDPLRAHCSIKYAGDMLVRRTIVQTIRDKEYFANMWIPLNTDSNTIALHKKLIERYSSIAVSLPLGVGKAEYFNAASILDMIIESSQINSGAIIDLEYQKFVATIKLKYFNLFYMIANYLKAKRDEGCFAFNMQRKTFKIYLAGCGSKGIKFCIGGDDLSSLTYSPFGKSVLKMMRTILGLDSDFFLQIVEPQSETKEEVVAGLTMMIKAAQSNGIDDDAADEIIEKAEVKDEDETAIIDNHLTKADDYKEDGSCEIDELKAEYEKLLIEIIHCAGIDEFKWHDEENSIIETVDYKNVMDYIKALYGGVNERLQESNPPTAIYKKCFASFLLDGIIDTIYAREENV